jgi:hypothetical protein
VAAELGAALERLGERLRRQVQRHVDVEHPPDMEDEDALRVAGVEVANASGSARARARAHG